MEWLKAVLPTVASAFGGPLAGIAATFVSQKMGLDVATVDAVSKAIQGASPEQMVQLKQIDADLQKYFASLDIKLEELATTDRDSARKRESSTLDSMTPRVLAAVVVGGFMFMVSSVLLGNVEGLKSPAISGIVGTLIGYVSAKADQVVSYYFGSTATSRQKNELIASLRDDKSAK